jgi:N-acetylmuramoyl-L-alanine amidase
MRRTIPVLLALTIVPAVIVLPTITPVRPAPHPVAPHVVTRALTGVDPASLAALQAEASIGAAQAHAVLPHPAVLTAPMTTAGFQAVGLTWDAGAVTTGMHISLRVKDDASGWGSWQPLTPPDEGPDAGSVDARHSRSGTDPLVTGPSDGVQVRVDTGDGRAPAGLKVMLVDPGTSGADSAIGATPPASSADAAQSEPTIVTRAQWGADESLRNGFAGYSDTLKVGFIHHTASSNAYTNAAGAAQQIRAIYAYDTEGLGWSDIAYNFLVDKFGNIYEGRAGGVSLPVISASTAGFNYESFAVSALGCFDTTCGGSGSSAPSSAMLSSIARVVAWKLGLNYLDPMGSSVLVSSGTSGTNLNHPAGQHVTTPTVSGHRDVDATACPGNRLYPMLPTIRAMALADMQAGVVTPTLTAATAYGGSGATARAAVLANQTFHMSITDGCRGGTLATLSGSASRSAPISSTWNGTRPGGSPALPGPYRATITSSSSAGAAVPWSGWSVVNAPPPDPMTAGAAVNGSGGYHAVTPARLLDTRSGVFANGTGGRVDLQLLGRAGIPATGVSAVAMTVTATCATASSYLTAFAGGTTQPPTSDLNLAPGQTRASLVVVPVGTNGMVSVGNYSGVTQFVVDVLGYYTLSGGAELTAVPLTRVYDSRVDPAGKLASGTFRTLTLPTIDGVPGSSISAVVANLTVYSPTAPGYVSVYPGGSSWPGTSTMNYPAGPGMDTSVFASVVGGQIVVRNVGSPVDLAVDVIGVMTPHAVLAGGRFTAITPHRVLDTRTTGSRLGQTVLPVLVADGTTVPTGVSAALVIVTGVEPTTQTTMIAWPDDGSAMPGGAFLRLVAGDVRANVAVVAVGSDGKVLLKNAAGQVDVVMDVLGYYQ